MAVLVERSHDFVKILTKTRLTEKFKKPRVVLAIDSRKFDNRRSQVPEALGAEGIKHVVSFVPKNACILLRRDWGKLQKIPDESDGATSEGPLALPVDAQGFVDHVEQVRSNHRNLIDEDEVEVIDDASKAVPVIMQGAPLVNGAVDVPAFDEAALIKALRVDQAGESTFPEFLNASWRAGVVRDEVDLEARTVTYQGSNVGEYIEAYPAVTVSWLLNAG